MNKRSDCATSGTNFADDYCLLTSLLAEKWVQQANECVAKACTEVGGCLEAVFK